MDQEQLKIALEKKAELIRVANLYLTAPFMVYLALKGDRINNFDKKILLLLGIGTISVNYKLYKEKAVYLKNRLL